MKNLTEFLKFNFQIRKFMQENKILRKILISETIKFVEFVEVKR